MFSAVVRLNLDKMKTNVAVFFGGRSVEHEISVISALQAINAFNAEKYNIVPIYIKAGQMVHR